MILNIHGYNGEAANLNYKVLQEINCGETVISPQIDYNNIGANELLGKLKDILTDNKINFNSYEKIDGENSKMLIIGHSLGGFCAYCLAGVLDREGMKCNILLTNPCLFPPVTLPNIGGYALSDEVMKETAELGKKYIGKYEKSKISAIVGLRDELIDHANISDFAANVCTFDDVHNFADTPEYRAAVARFVNTGGEIFDIQAAQEW
jgi:predicted esterase YcpF (UPF0227 family)